MRFEAITPDRFAKTRIRRNAGWGHAASIPIVPIVPGELAKVAASYPIVFGRFAEDQPLAVCAVMGLEIDRNAYVGEGGRWRGSYIPSILRRYPFALVKAPSENESEAERLAVCLDADSDLLTEDPEEGQPLFDEDGNKTEFFEKTLQFLTKLQSQQQRLNAVTGGLAEADILEPITVTRPPNVKDDDESWKPLRGVMRVDEGKLNQLDDESFLKLRRNGVLSLIYLSLATTAQWEKLRNMHMLTRDPAAFAGADGGRFGVYEDVEAAVYDLAEPDAGPLRSVVVGPL